MAEEERLAIARERTIQRMRKKTMKERVKAFVRRHIHMDDDKSALIKLKKAVDGPAYTYEAPDLYSNYCIDRGDGARIKTKKEGGFGLLKIFASKKKESFPVFGAPKKTLKGRAAHVKKRAKNAASHVKKHAKNHFSFAHNNPALEYLGRWERKWHRALHVLSFLIPVLILGYVVYMNILPFGYSGSLMLDVGAEGDDDPTREIYLSDPNKVLTVIQRYGKDTFRVVKNNEPFHIIFNSPINLDEKTRVTMDVDYEGASPLYIEYFDPLINQTTWKRYYKNNYKPEEDGYIRVAFFPGNMIYAKESVVQQKCKRQNITDCSIDAIKSGARQFFKHNTSAMMNPTPESAINWLLDNAKYDSVLFLSEDFDALDVPNPVDYHEGEWTEIDADLRKNHQFYVYLNNTLNLTITKKDYNWYNGSDEVSVELYDLNNTLIFQDIIPDDGIINKSKKYAAPVVKTMTSEVKKGTYLLKLNYIKDTNAHPDYYIDKIRINTNKIVTTGTVLPVSETTLYTNANDRSTISFKYWHGGKDQDIIVDGDDSQIIELTKDDISKNIRKTISGKNTYYFPKGDVAISSNQYFSFNKSNYFEPSIFGINDNQVPQYIVYGGTYKSWIYTKNIISLKSGNLRINNIKMVFKHV